MTTLRTFGFRSFAAGALLAGCAAAVALPLVAARPALGQQQRSAKDAERQKWENKIVFFGEEETNSWSLRIFDKTVTERATARYTEMWKYDVDAGKWVKVDDGGPSMKIVMPNEKPANADPETQVIGELPIKPGEVGVYYVKWRINNEIDGATFCRIGPGLAGDAAKRAKENPPKVEKGYMATVVPLDLNRAELRSIPDPRFHTGQAAEGKPTTTKPAGK